MQKKGPYSRKEAKTKVVTETFGSLISSRFCQFSGLLLLAVFGGIFHNIPVLCVPLLLHVFYFGRSIMFELFLLNHHIELSLGLWQWYHLVIPGIYLGALPMQPLGHESELVDKLGVQVELTFTRLPLISLICLTPTSMSRHYGQFFALCKALDQLPLPISHQLPCP